MSSSTDEQCLATVDKIMRACAKGKFCDRKAIEKINEVTKLALEINEEESNLKALIDDKSEKWKELQETEKAIQGTQTILTYKSEKFLEIFDSERG